MRLEEISEKKAWRTLGLRDEEYDRIKEILNRPPNWTELGMFSVLWSEHCGYKHSRPVLKGLPTEGPRVLVGPGENAGVVDIGDGLAVAFRIESHNHPVAVEPYHGAATGIGGIVRDILASGARPVALFNSLRFGPLHDPHVRDLFSGALSGVSNFGSCIGVPTMGGEAFFEESYTLNPLCNVLCVGLVAADKVASGTARGVENPVMLVGSSTGRDGLGGASFASAELEGDTEERLPVAIGDPSMARLLIEACLEMLESGAVVAIQDMGAAGITSSCCETAARGGVGMEIDLDGIQLREPGMTPFDILLSESQERMLIIAEKGREGEITEIAKKWGIGSTVLGRVTHDGLFRVKAQGKVVAEVPARGLAEEAPTYTPEAIRPAYLEKTRRFDMRDLPLPDDLSGVLANLLSSPNIASKEAVWPKYPSAVRSDPVMGPGGDAAILGVEGTDKGICLSVDGNGRYTYLDPWAGGALAVAEAARNVSCSGATPLGATNCLNFPNPEKPEVYWQFIETVRGMGDACRALGIPITGGNVSFYNETEGKPIYPTPVVGVLGVLRHVAGHLTSGFKVEGDLIGLLGLNLGELGGTEYLKVIHQMVSGRAPRVDLRLEAAVQETCRRAVPLLNSAHDCSDGGLAVTIAECCFLAESGAKGAMVDLRGNLRPDALLFGESPSRIVVSFPEGNLGRLKVLAAEIGTPFEVIGRVSGSRLVLSQGDPLVDCDVKFLEERWRNSLRWAISS